MKTIEKQNFLMKTCLGLAISCTASFLLLLSSVSLAEDIELYISEGIKQAKTRPQVLIIFDNSGSMGTEEWVKEAYVNDPDNPYPAVGGLHSLSENFIYFTKGGIDGATMPVPDSPSESRRFLDAINSCETARDILNTVGFYTGHIREYTFKGNSGSWQEIPDNNGGNINVIDCQDDVLAPNDKNAGILAKNGSVDTLPDGYPVDGQGNKGSPVYHTDNIDSSKASVSWTGPLVTLYTDNYLRWHQSSVIGKEWKSRLDIAKESVTNLIYSSPYVDFGLQVFNSNSGSDNDNGGRIVHGIQESTLASTAVLVDIINNKIADDTWTPLCETLYEASRYFGGKSVDFGDDDDTFDPRRDKSIETSGKIYQTPFSACADRVYVIMITDGEPTWDIDADTKIGNMPESGQTPMGSTYKVSDPKTWDRGNSMLPALAEWMFNNDLNSTLDGKQTSQLFTIGFGQDAKDDAEELLTEAATRGGGKYFYAEDTASLTEQLTKVLESLDPSNDTLTSASVAANNFDRTQTLDSVYYAMFQPDRGPRWQGNVKKYRLINKVQKGKSGKDAVTADGYFSEDATSYWSSEKDGDTVSKGGVAGMLQDLTSKRTIYSDLGASGALVALTRANAISTNAFGSSAALAAELDVIDDDDIIDDHLNWAMGINVDNAKPLDWVTGDAIPYMRPDVFGDPLHSKPVVINYGNDQIYIVVGTNQGALHLFKDESPKSTTGAVTETWAFMPKEFFSKIKPLRENFATSEKVYGLDGLITAHIVDHNGNGVVDTVDGDEVWIFFGLRRGGNSYYALNLTQPTSPTKMWKIKGGTGDFTDLGQTWSQPKVTYSKLNLSGTTAKPTLVFGGGYDINKDNSGIGTSDSVGKSVYMVDAESGDLLWSTASTQFTDSIPASIGTLDSTGNGMADRLYFGDTGGNVWRVDMPDKVTSKFSLFKLAAFNDDTTNSGDIRFFNEPSIVRAFITETLDSGQKDDLGNAIIVKQEVPYDAVLIGSGDRSNPLGKDTDDVFYMIKDINIKSQEFTASSTPAIPSPIVLADLFNYTNNPFKGLTGTALDTKAIEVSLMSGWYYNFEQGGEKSSASALVINNVAYFTSYTPPDLTASTANICNIASGAGWLYAVDLALGVKKYNWLTEDNDQGLNRKDTIKYISEQFLGSPTLIVTKETGTDEPEGDIIVGRTVLPVGFTLQTIRTYLTVDE